MSQGAAVRSRNVALDGFVVLGLVVVCLAGWRHYTQTNRVPFEDAAMLLRYATNLADGHGVAFNAGGPHVDGATDFLSVFLLGGLIRLGASAANAVRSLDLVAHLATVLVVYLMGRFVHRSPVLVAIAPALFLAVGPALVQAAAHFASPLFGLFVALTVAGAYIVRETPTDGRRVATFAVVALLMALTRPEGVILAVLILAVVVWWVGRQASALMLLRFLAIFGTGGLIYFAWHWLYFGFPLPNPYYKKGGGSLHLDGLRDSVHVVWAAAWPLVLLVVLGLVIRRARREAFFVLVPAAGFTAIWVLLASETNYAGRFQYPVVVILALGVAPLANRLLEGVTVRRSLVLAGVALLPFLVAVAVYNNRYLPALYTDVDVAVAHELEQFGPSARMAVSEAGVLPLYSGWRALDTWGLNDRTIAHRGHLVNADLDAFQPDVIMFHAPFSPKDTTPVGDFGLPGWTRMTVTMNDYAASHGYQLAAAYGGRHDCRYFFVRTTWPQSAAAIAAIRSVEAKAGVPDLNS